MFYINSVFCSFKQCIVSVFIIFLELLSESSQNKGLSPCFLKFSKFISSCLFDEVDNHVKQIDLFIGESVSGYRIQLKKEFLSKIVKIDLFIGHIFCKRTYFVVDLLMNA